MISEVHVGGGLEVAEHLGDLEDISSLYLHRSALRLYQGDREGAREDLETCLTLAHRSGSVRSLLNALSNALMQCGERHAVKAAKSRAHSKPLANEWACQCRPMPDKYWNLT